MLVSANPEILSKISRGGGVCFCQSGNPLKNIKGWRCLFEKRNEIDDDDDDDVFNSTKRRILFEY